jgi:ubiquitin carboxyl-terminal hydrolase 4/11/15
MPTSEFNDDEGISLNDELYDSNTTAATLANQEASWGFEVLGEDDNTTSVNTPADTASDRPDAGSDAGDRLMELVNDEHEKDRYGDNDSPPPLMDDETMIEEGQEQFDGPNASTHDYE